MRENTGGGGRERGGGERFCVQDKERNGERKMKEALKEGTKEERKEEKPEGGKK